MPQGLPPSARRTRSRHVALLTLAAGYLMLAGPLGLPLAKRAAAAPPRPKQGRGKRDRNAAGLSMETQSAPRSRTIATELESPGPFARAPELLSVKYVSYLDAQGQPIITPAQAAQVIRDVNAVFRPCAIQFRLDHYVKAYPKDYGVPFSLHSVDQMDVVRAPFSDAAEIVIINTGDWDHKSIGAANAWTAMPGSEPSGAVIEGQVARNSEIVAHELGHYLGLDHVNDTSNLLNAIIYKSSLHLTAGQCTEMRRTAENARRSAQREPLPASPDAGGAARNVAGL